MDVLILNGSFRNEGNTVTLLKPFIEELRSNGADTTVIDVCDKKIAPCDACWSCQEVLDSYGCAKNDDMHEIVNEIFKADCFILATPIYTWYCTPPMKALLDRHFGLNKYYGKEGSGPSLWAGKKCGIVATCGYEIEYGAGPFEDGIKRLCEHSQLEYLGMLAVRDIDDRASFETPEAIRAAVEFARTVLGI